MKAVIFDAFSAPPQIRDLPDPTPAPGGVVVKVMATGVCRSDWHGWVGHDPDITPPHVPGHEFAGVVEAVGTDVITAKIGDRVTAPFVCGCGACRQCRSGYHQICDHQSQPGFTHWGSFAEYVAIHHADVNLVSLPDEIDFTTAASLGCRFATAFRAVVDQGRVAPGDWVAVHGCGGVGLSAVMIANALGASVIAIDIGDKQLALAQDLGAVGRVNAAVAGDVVEAVREISGGGVHLSVDALGHPQTCFNSISNLRKRGRHVQVGLMPPELGPAKVPMSAVIARELEILGSHGMQAYRYDSMLSLILSGKLAPDKLIGRTITLLDSIEALMHIPDAESAGVTVVTEFH